MRDCRLRDCEDIELIRLRADIQDLFLAGLSPYLTMQRENVVGVSKHLCGVATDLTIRLVNIQYHTYLNISLYLINIQLKYLSVLS